VFAIEAADVTMDRTSHDNLFECYVAIAQVFFTVVRRSEAQYASIILVRLNEAITQ
jgi:hypothetical protein